MNHRNLITWICAITGGVSAITAAVYILRIEPTPTARPSSSTQSLLQPTETAIQENAIDDLYLAPGLWAEVSIVDRGEALELSWYKSNAGAGIKTDIALSATQKLATQAWATSVAAGIGGELIICAKLRSGETRISRLLVAAPLVALEQAGPKLVPQPPLGSEILYQGAEVGKDTVSLSIRNRGLIDHFFMRFHETKDLYDVNLSTTPPGFTLIAEVSQTPGLGADFNDFHAGEHTTSGYVYTFQELDLDFMRVSTDLNLVDSNKDGTIDYIGPIDTNIDQTLDLIGIEHWVEVRGIPTIELMQ